MGQIQREQLEEFRSEFGGDTVLPGDSEYDETREVWNAMIDRRPAVIARCTSSGDVVQAVNFAREHNLVTSIRGAGHNIAGTAVCEGGIMIDLSPMKQVSVDPSTRRASVEPGCTLGDFDAAAQEHGLATPVGINSTTGIAGLTLGGGFGWLSRKYGMTIDNLISAEVVTADGNLVHASESENADLFWGIRGGGGNFGVVTNFEFQLHPVGPDVLSGLIVYPFDEAKSVLEQFAEFTMDAPEELCVWTVVRMAPPLPFLPEEVHGTGIVAIALFWAGDPEKGEEAIEPLRSFGKVLGEHVGVQPYAAWQQAFDPLLTPGSRNYWKTHNFTELDDGVFDAIIEYAETFPSPQCEIFIAAVDGALNRVPADAMAYSSRDARYVMNVHARWESPEKDDECIGWARDFFAASKPFASEGAYVNFMTQDEADRVASAYGTSYDRLVALKSKYDPSNLFRTNQNIVPA